MQLLLKAQKILKKKSVRIYSNTKDKVLEVPALLWDLEHQPEEKHFSTDILIQRGRCVQH